MRKFSMQHKKHPLLYVAPKLQNFSICALSKIFFPIQYFLQYGHLTVGEKILFFLLFGHVGLPLGASTGLPTPRAARGLRRRGHRRPRRLATCLRAPLRAWTPALAQPLGASPSTPAMGSIQGLSEGEMRCLGFLANGEKIRGIWSFHGGPTLLFMVQTDRINRSARQGREFWIVQQVFEVRVLWKSKFF